MEKQYTKADLVKAWKSGYEEGYQDALIDENNDYLEPKHDQGEMNIDIC